MAWIEIISPSNLDSPISEHPARRWGVAFLDSVGVGYGGGGSFRNTGKKTGGFGGRETAATAGPRARRGLRPQGRDDTRVSAYGRIGEGAPPWNPRDGHQGPRH